MANAEVLEAAALKRAVRLGEPVGAPRVSDLGAVVASTVVNVELEKAGDESSRLGAKVAAEDAKGALDRAEATLAKGASEEGAAAAVVKKIAADLDTAQSAIDKVVGADKQKKTDADADAKAKAEADTKAKADAEAKVAPWKCEYCGHENAHDLGKCEQCGAPKSEEKKADAKQ